MRPFRAWIVFYSVFPGRCPGLYYYALSGLSLSQQHWGSGEGDKNFLISESFSPSPGPSGALRQTALSFRKGCQFSGIGKKMKVSEESVSYRFPIEKIPAGRQKQVFACSKNRIFLKNLCFRSMANRYKTFMQDFEGII